MILGDPQTPANTESRTTLDDLFRQALERRPDALALADAPNRPDFTSGAPRRLSFAQADRIVSAIAGRLMRLGLPVDAVIGLQLPNTVEHVLALLGVLRAGMIAAPMPLLWRRADAANALGRVGARGIVAHSRLGSVNHCEIAMHAAAEVFSIRYVCGFGDAVPDGVIPFDDLLAAAAAEPLPPIERQANPAAHLALITWEVTPNGLLPVVRNHNELIAGGLAVMLEGGMREDAVLIAPCALGSFAGLALSVLPWLLTGGTLHLHQAFDPAVFAAQCAQERCDTVALPAALAPVPPHAGPLDHPALRNVLALWRTPERLAASPSWHHGHASLIDVLAFGEIGLIAARRGKDGRTAEFPLGTVSAPSGAPGAVAVAEIARTDAGTLALGGPMVPHHPFPPGVERSDAPRIEPQADGLIDTGYACRIDRATRALIVTGPPPGIVSVGGYRFVLRDLHAVTSRVDEAASLAALPDALAGHRLAGTGGKRAAVQAALSALGVNPLLADAFRDRGPDAPVA